MYLHEASIIVLVSRFPTVPERRILPVEVKAIEVVLPEELDGVLHEFPSSVRVGHHRRESTGPLVPSADR